MSALTFKQRLQLYKTAKKPRKQIRLKLEIITNGLNLPRVHKCETKVKEIFKLTETNKIQPQIQEYVERKNLMREHKAVSSREKENLQVLRYQNQVRFLRTANQLFQERLKLNSQLEKLSREADGKTDQIVMADFLNFQ